MFKQMMHSPVNFLSKCSIDFLLIIYLILFSIDFVSSNLHSSTDSANQTNCGLNLRIDSESKEHIKISNHMTSLNKRINEKYCDIFLLRSSELDQILIELNWFFSTTNYLQIKSVSYPNRTVLFINSKKHPHQIYKSTNSMQRAGNLISKKNLVLRVQNDLRPYIDNLLLIKIKCLKLIRLEFKKLSLSNDQPFCLNIYNVFFVLDLNEDLQTSMLIKNANYYLNISSLSNQNCVKIKLKTFHNSKLIIQKVLDTCLLNQNLELIDLIRSTNIELRTVNANENALICLNLVNLVNSTYDDLNLIKKNYTESILNSKKLKRNSKPIELDSLDEDKIDNCFYLNEEDQNQSNDSIRCFVLFENKLNKLNFENADHFCKRTFLPYGYSDAQLAILNTSYALDFVKKFVYR